MRPTCIYFLLLLVSPAVLSQQDIEPTPHNHLTSILQTPDPLGTPDQEPTSLPTTELGHSDTQKMSLNKLTNTSEAQTPPGTETQEQPQPTTRSIQANGHEVSLKTYSIGKKGKVLDGSNICGNITGKNSTDPVPCRSFAHEYVINISQSEPCVFRCSYDPSQLSPLRFEVHQKYCHPIRNPTFVYVQQNYFLSSWTLPVTFPSKLEEQKFTSFEAILCPPVNSSKEVVEFSITTRSEDPKAVQIGLHNVSFVIMKHINVSVIVSPVSSWYKLYRWDVYEESVLVTVASKSDVCAILVLQDAKCPVSTETTGLKERGRYQTFTKQAGMVARRLDFPHGVHIIVVSLPDDESCFLNLADTQSNKSYTERTKSVILEVYNHATISTTWYIYLFTAGVISALVLGVTVFTLFFINRNLSAPKNNTDDESSLLGESCISQQEYRVEATGGAVFCAGEVPAYSSSTVPGSDLSQNSLNQSMRPATGASVGDSEETGRGNSMAIAYRDLIQDDASQGNSQPIVVGQPLDFLPATTYAPQEEALSKLSNTFNPQFVWWWKIFAVKELGTAEAQVSEVGFQNSLFIMGVFSALPTAELLRSYLWVLHHRGQEDQCFYNSRCLTAFGSLPDFSRVFTNLGYILLGIAFIFIVRKHKSLTQDILKHFNADNNVGVSHHYGLFLTLGYGLIIQGVMSALYHTCPNSVTIKFDMMFMYVVMAVALVTIWGLRHGDVTHHVYSTVIAVGLTLLAAECRTWMSNGWFWGLLSTVYGVVLLSNAVLLSTHGIWSFSLRTLWKVWHGWQPVAKKLKDVLHDRDVSSRPMQVLRVVVGLGSNVALILYGILQDPNVYNFILVVCLVNMGLYFLNYVMAKTLSFREKGTIVAWVCLGSSFVLWIVALVFFSHSHTDSEGSPAESRSKNSPCDFLEVYDDHDIWHFTSAFALFFFFVVLLTMDDDLCFTPSKRISVA